MGAFKNLITIERKWKLVFQILFPKVPENDIPSPYIHDYSNIEARSSDAASSHLETFRNVLREKFWAHYRVEILLSLPDFNTSFDTIYDEALEGWKDAAKPNLSSRGQDGYLTPPTSAESSPEMAVLEVNNLNGLPQTPPPATMDMPNPWPANQEIRDWQLMFDSDA